MSLVCQSPFLILIKSKCNGYSVMLSAHHIFNSHSCQLCLHTTILSSVLTWSIASRKHENLSHLSHLTWTWRHSHINAQLSLIFALQYTCTQTLILYGNSVSASSCCQKCFLKYWPHYNLNTAPTGCMLHITKRLKLQTTKKLNNWLLLLVTIGLEIKALDFWLTPEMYL